MTSEEYKAERKLRKLSQAALMKLVGVTQATISSRETGRRDIKKEAEIAIKSLPIPKQNDKSALTGGARARPRKHQ